MNKVNITTEDGIVLSATVFKPADTLKAGVIINSATAVKQTYYSAFANFLCDNGYVIITYDYRGIGESKAPSKAASKLTMRNWGERDLEAVIQWASKSYADIDWHCVGHSVGGQLVGLAPSNNQLKSTYCVASQNGYWQHWGLAQKPKLLLTWYVLVPTFTQTLGYLPGFIFGGEMLPKGIAKEWARWCRHPEYISDAEGQALRKYFAEYSQEMKFVVIEDDLDFAPLRAVQALHDMYSKAKRELHKISPEEAGANVIGHFGFFRKQFKDSLWIDALNWLSRAA